MRRDGGPARPALRSMRWMGGIAMVSATLGCGATGAPGDAAFAVRDSAGIRIVENGSFAWGEGEQWRFADTPELDIGVVEGDSVYQLFRVSAATRLNDGRLAIGNSGTHEVRYFDADGRFLSAIGGEGEGPGEFSYLQSIFPFRGDSVLAWDLRLQRASVLTSGGALGRIARVEGQPTNPRVLQPFADGTFLRLDERFDLSGQGVQQQIMVVTRHDPGGALLDSIGELPFTKTVVIGSGPDGMVGTPGFSAHTSVAVHDDRYYVGVGAAPQVEVRADSGMVIGLVRWPDHDRTVTEDDIATYRSGRLHAIEDENERRRRRSYYESLPFESEFPAYRQLITDRVGNLWIERYPPPGATGPRRWLVIDTAGRALGEVEVRERLRVLEIGEDYVLGVERDELEVEHVRLYRLHKATSD